MDSDGSGFSTDHSGTGLNLMVQWLVGLTVYICSGVIVTGQSLHTADSIRSDVRLIGLTEQGWRFSDEQEPNFTAKTLLRWGSWPGVRENQCVWLSDGSWLCGNISVSRDGSVIVENDWLATPVIPLTAVRGLVLNPPASLQQWCELQAEMSNASGEQDLIWLSSERKLAGIIRWGSETGSFEQSLRLESGGQLLELALEDVQAVVLSPSLVGPLPDRNLSEGESGIMQGVELGLKDGSFLRIRDFQIDESTLELSLLSRLKLSSYDTVGEFVSSVRYIQAQHSHARSDRSVYLSDLKVAQYRYAGNSRLKWELGIDRDVLGRPLWLSDGLVPTGVVAKGLAMHSSSRAAYRWDGSAGRLLAELVFAEPQVGATRQLGSVECQVLLAREGKLETAVRTRISRSGTEPNRAEISVDVTGAQLIVLVTEQSDFGQFGDHVLWLDARVAKQP